MDILSSSLQQIGVSMKEVGQALSYTWFIVLPPLFYFLFKELWMHHIMGKFGAAPDWVVLELIPPKNIERSPKPMENFIMAFAGVEKTFTPIEKYIDGAFTDYMSLEIVGDSGSFHFYIRTMKKFRNLVEAHLYAQYPDVEIIEVPDYVNDVPKVIPNSQWDSWGTDFELSKDNAYPIRTYTQFEESVTGKMIDPLAGLIETMGKLGPNQKIWLQWIIQPTSPKWASVSGKPLLDKLTHRETKHESIMERIRKDITDVFTNIPKAFHSAVEFEAGSEKKEDQPLEFRLSPGERDVLKAVEENLGKIQFYVKGRFIFLGRRENFDKGVGLNAFFGAMRPFNDENLNSLKPNNSTKTSPYYVFIKPRMRYLQYKLLRRYRERSLSPNLMVMSVEELATLFHFPDMQVLAPSLTRTEAKRGGAPANLPIE